MDDSSNISVLEEKSSHLIQLISDDFKDPVMSTPTPVPSDLSHPTGHNLSLHTDVPTFDGDPIKWEKGHSDLEIKGHLLQAVKHPEGQTLLNNLPCHETGLDSMLATLKDRFGCRGHLPHAHSKDQSGDSVRVEHS